MWVLVFADANLTLPRSCGGFFVAIVGALGSHFPIVWRSWVLSHATTSSAESETLTWSEAAKAAICVAAVLEATRKRSALIEGKVDAEALRLAVARGASSKMAHLRRSAGLSLSWLHDCGILLSRVPGAENVSDVFTKNLTAVRLRALVKLWFGLDDAPTAPRGVRAAMARAAEWLLLGHEPECALSGTTHTPDVEQNGCTCGAGKEAVECGEALAQEDAGSEELLRAALQYLEA
jgi:hypothetical protein